MRTRTLLTQVLAVNTALVAGTAIVAALIARGRLGDVFELQRMLLLGLAVASAVLLNSLLLRRRLRPTALDDHGMVPALASQVADFGERTGIRSTFHRHGAPPELSDEEQLVLYRVTQESLSNVVQHSGASTVRVELSSIGRTVLRVRDDGCGFKIAANGSARNRLGVSGMRERALLVG